MSSVNIRSSSSTQNFYENVDDSNWKVDKLRKRFVCIMKKYIIMYEKLEMTMKKTDVLETSFVFVATKARLHEILCDIQTSFESKSLNIFIEWRFKILTELIYKMNNNALKYKKRGQDSVKKIIEQSKKQNDENDSNFDHWKHSREKMFRELSTCTTFKNKIVLTKQSFNKMLKINCCNTIELMKQKKSLKEITAQNLNFDI